MDCKGQVEKDNQNSSHALAFTRKSFTWSFRRLARKNNFESFCHDLIQNTISDIKLSNDAS